MNALTITSESVWKDHQKELKKFVRSRVNNKLEADDIMQEVFIKLHLNIYSLNDPARITSWLYQVTRNLITDHFRKNKKTIDVETVPIPDEIINNKNDSMFFIDCISKLVKRLPLQYRTALTKVDLEKVSQLDFARQLDISYSGAKSRVQRARQLLKKYLTDCCEIVADKYGNIVSHKRKLGCSCSQ